jgi:hypothetical protein
MDEAIVEGAYSCLYKPFSVDDIIKILEKIEKEGNGGE